MALWLDEQRGGMTPAARAHWPSAAAVQEKGKERNET
jgi:hypothetical protein